MTLMQRPAILELDLKPFTLQKKANSLLRGYLENILIINLNILIRKTAS